MNEALSRLLYVIGAYLAIFYKDLSMENSHGQTHTEYSFKSTSRMRKNFVVKVEKYFLRKSLILKSLNTIKPSCIRTHNFHISFGL